MKQKIKQKLKLPALLIVLIHFIPGIHSYSFAATPILQKGDLVVNEVNWMGSTIANKNESTDEWIEIANTTENDISLTGIDLTINTTVIPLDGIIKANGFYVISRLAVDTSSLSFTDKVNTKISIPNASFQIKLSQTGILIDDVNTVGKAPFAGTNDSESTKATMARVSTAADGNNLASWKSSNSRSSLKKGADYCKNFATPGAENFSNPNETVLEFEDGCDGNLILTADKNSVVINGQTKTALSAYSNYDFGNENTQYEIELASTQSSIKADTLGISINFSDENTITYFKNTSENLKIKFIKPASLATALISILLDIEANQFVSLDKLIIKKLPLNTGKDYESINPSNPFISTEEINPLSKLRYSADFSIKFLSLNSLISPFTIAAVLKTSNPLTKESWTEPILSKEIVINKGHIFSNFFISDIYGFYQHEVIFNEGFTGEFTELQVKQQPLTQEIKLNTSHFLAEKAKPNADNGKLSFPKNTNAFTKLVSLNNSSVCSLNKSCSFSIPVVGLSINSDQNNVQALDVFLAGSTADNKRYQIIKHVKTSDLIHSSDIVVELPYPNLTNISYGLFSYGNIDIELGDITVSDKLSNVVPLIESSREINWIEPHDLKRANNIIDIFTSPKPLEPGNYSLTYNLQKKTSGKSTDDLLKVVAYDDTGKKLFERLIEDGDLSEFKTTEFKDSFELTKTQNVKIIIRWVMDEDTLYIPIVGSGFILNK
jgi:hypothetical protein